MILSKKFLQNDDKNCKSIALSNYRTNINNEPIFFPYSFQHTKSIPNNQFKILSTSISTPIGLPNHALISVCNRSEHRLRLDFRNIFFTDTFPFPPNLQSFNSISPNSPSTTFDRLDLSLRCLLIKNIQDPVYLD